jgi:release factor glutamine methyltransferase
MYTPREDSYLILSCINKYIKKNIKFLEIGAGSGIISQNAQKMGAVVLAVDIDEDVVKELKNKKINAIQSNLFSNVKGKFDIIVFNPPYLPEDKYDKQADTSGGQKGDETIINFLRQASDHLNKNGKILLLLSSLTPRTKINKILRNFNQKKIAEEKLFFETLEVLEISSDSRV